jgi:WD40 repeat protein
MSVQTGSVTMVALGVVTHPTLRPGVHLRWFVDPGLGFPPLGFDVFRRPERLGNPSSLTFKGESEGVLPQSFTRGATAWSTASGQTPSEIFASATASGDVRLLRPSGTSAITCRMDRSERPIRRIEIDIVHDVPQFTRLLPFEFVVWGIAGDERVARGAVTLTQQNALTVVGVTITGDALEGFQIEGGRQINNFYGILGVRWSPVLGEADVGWGTPLNPRRIGFPSTMPGYLVTHKYSPDKGLGMEDWLEAADRLSPTGAHADLTVPLSQRFGPPTFTGTRQVLEAALARRSLTKASGSAQEPTISLDAVQLVLIGALDPDFARLAGLGLVDSSAVPSERYDYKLVAYWPGKLRQQVVCVDVPNGGGQIPTGGTVSLPGGGGGTTLVTAGTILERPNPGATLEVAGVAGAAWSPDGQRIVTWRRAGGVRVWHLSGDELLKLAHDTGALAAAWSPDGQQVMTWAEDQIVRLWRVADGSLQQAMKHPSPVLGAGWRAQGDRFVTWAEDGNVRIWDASASVRPLTSLSMPKCTGAVWSPDGQRMLGWAQNGEARIWAVDGAGDPRLLRHPSRLLGAAWSPDGQEVLSWADNGDLLIWPGDGSADPRLLRHPPGLLGAAWSPDGKLLLSWHRDGAARLWETASGSPVRIFSHDVAVVGAAWSPDGRRMLTWTADGVLRVFELEVDAPPLTFTGAGKVIGASWGGGHKVVTWTGNGVAQIWEVPGRIRTLTFALPAATDWVRLTGRSAGPEPLTIRAFIGSEIATTQVAPSGPVTTITVEALGTTSVTVTGNEVTVTQICRLQMVREPDLQEVWMCFGVTPQQVPSLTPPAQLAATALPGFARDGFAEQFVGLVIEPPPPPRSARDLYPRGRSIHDPVAYEVRRRADGAQPVADPATGPWLDLITDPFSGEPFWADMATLPAAGQVRPVVRSTLRPALHSSPSGWPAGPQDLVDGRLDPNVRYYSYRVRGRDLFGRLSDWSPLVTVDAADRVAPPAPAALSARWIDRADSWLGLDDMAELAAAGVDRAIVARWSWPKARREQAPDSQTFRVYWHSRPMSIVLSTITTDPQVAAATYTVSVGLGLGGAPPADAFHGDWLRQDNRQYLIRASSATDPTTLTLDATDLPPPTRGFCALSMRAPDPQRLDLLGNPLRPDKAHATAWERRARQGPIITVEAAILQRTSGVVITCSKVQPNTPRPQVTTVVLNPDWHWSGALPEAPELVIGTEAPWRVLGSTLGRVAVLLVDTKDRKAPPVGQAVLRATDMQTLVLNAQLPATAPFTVLGGTASADGSNLEVLGHATAPLRLIVAPVTNANRLIWLPDHQVVLDDITLPVTDTMPQATGHVGVSAVDGRPWTADLRTRPGEPGGPGNEGPVASVAIRRDYLAVPTATVTPAGTTGPDELWAPIPDEFSGQTRFPLRWSTAGANNFHIDHATLDAVLDADLADRAARRGAYVGLPALDAPGLAQWRTKQAVLSAADLQKLATAQPTAFLPLTPGPLSAADPLLADTQTGWLRWLAPLDGSAPGRHFLRVRAIDAAGNSGPPGPSTLPIRVPDAHRPLPPRLRGVIASDRALWVEWDATDPEAGEYRIMRIDGATTPDPAGMLEVATVQREHCPGPLRVVGGQLHLPGATPNQLIALYDAAEYDPVKAPGAQSAQPLAGSFSLAGTTVSGIGLPDGTLLYAVVRPAPGASPTLATSPTARAYRDAAVLSDVPYQYRVVAVRQARSDLAATISVASLPSDAVGGVSYDARPPVPPLATAVWDATRAAVRVSWSPAGLPAGLELALQRLAEGDEMWQRASGWVAATEASFDDIAAVSGQTYTYRLRARGRTGRASQDEPVIGPVTIP